jgi:hypothetical protein
VKPMKLIWMTVCLLAIGMQAAADEYDDMFDSVIGDSAAEPEQRAADDGNDMQDDFCLTLSGEHISSLRTGIMEGFADFKGPFKSPQVINTLGIRVRQHDLRIVSDWQGKITMNEEGKRDGILSFSPLENYLMWAPPGFTLRFGFQYINWGTADSFNPTDNLNPGDYSLSPRAEKIPVLAFSLEYFPSSAVSLAVVYIPFDQQDIMPVDFAALLQTQFPASAVHTGQNEYDLSSFVAGVKCSFFMQYLDFSFSYIYNYDTYYTPDIELVDMGALYGVSAINLNKNRVHQLGCDVGTAIESVGVWAELGFEFQDGYSSESYTVRPPVLSWAAGFDLSYGAEDEHYLNIQYIGRFTFDYDHSFLQDYANGEPSLGQSEAYYREFYFRSMLFKLASQREALLHGAAVNLEWSFEDSLFHPSLSAVYLFPHLYEDKIVDQGVTVDYKRFGSLMLGAELDIMPFDSFHIRFGCDIFVSWHQVGDEKISVNRTSQIGSFLDNSSLYFKIQYKWGVDL